MIKSLAIYWIKVREFGLAWARITSIFSFPTHVHAHFAHKLQKITKHFQCGYKTETKIEIQNALCNFSKSPHMYKLPIVWLGALCGLYILPIYKWLAVCACEYSLSGCFMRSWLVWAVREREREHVWRFFVFVIVDVNLFVNVFIYYNCMGVWAFVCV